MDMQPPDDLDLKPPERRMWDAVMADKSCTFGDDDPRKLASPVAWGRERTIRGHVLAQLLTRAGASGASSIRQVQIQGARVIGVVDLSHAELTSVLLARCLFEDDIVLWLARARTLIFETCVLASVNADGASIADGLWIRQVDVRYGISLTGASVGQSVVLSGSAIAGGSRPAFSADRLQVGGSVLFDDGFRATGEVKLMSARIKGQLNCCSGQFKNPKNNALSADMAYIHGGVHLTSGFHAIGEVKLPAAELSGELNCSGGRFENRGGRALRADGANIQGNVLLSNEFHAIGEVRLLYAQISGALICSGGQFKNPGGVAFAADGSEIRGYVFLCEGFHATGEVRLVGTRINDQLICSSGRFNNPKKMALVADRAEIRGNASLSDGFQAEGEVRVMGARIGGQLDCSGGRFRNPKRIALRANRAKIDGSMSLGKLPTGDCFYSQGEVRLVGARITGQLNCAGGWFENAQDKALNLQEARLDSLVLRRLHHKTVGHIVLASAKTSLFADDPQVLAIHGITLHLDGFVYERIAPDSPQDGKIRLQWLELQGPGYHPQPFDQLAAVFRLNGQEQEARNVLVAKLRKRRETLHGLRSRCWDCFLDKSFLYGWQPWRPLAVALVVLLVAFGLVSGAQACSLVVGPSDATSPFFPFTLVVDVFLWNVDLGAESRWAIDTENGGVYALLVDGSLWLLKLVGWGAITLALAARTRIVRRE